VSADMQVTLIDSHSQINSSSKDNQEFTLENGIITLSPLQSKSNLVIKFSTESIVKLSF